MKYLVNEYINTTIKFTCKVEADSKDEAILKATDDGEWVRDEDYEAWDDYSEFKAEEL